MPDSEIQYYHHFEPFVLENGKVLESLTIAYHTFGELNADRSNVAWVCHALTADSNVRDWWPHTVEEDGFLDPARWYTVCANIIGSPYGTTSPLSENPLTGEPYYASFPDVTIRDIVRAHILLADYLGIGKIGLLVGSSVGGFQALEWIAEEPDRFEKLVLIATDAAATPWSVAVDETQRMAIRADATYGEPRPDAGQAGLAAARAIGLLTYRGSGGYNRTQQDPPGQLLPPGTGRPCTYQRHQGDKLCRRFNAYSYMTILNAFDTHDIGRDRHGVDAALAKVNTKAIVVGISTDIIFPPEDMRRLTGMLPGANYVEIDSDFGHDGFLIEHKQLNNILIPFTTQI
ncbi:MAG: homoserine O-acetyltransferase [Muribaculaceae bacterium]|nr:homoserine O-acetyltransferase [Muribaculaceae bacterium]